MQIQTILAELTVEALDEGVLSRLAWLDEVEFAPVFIDQKNIALLVSSGVVVANNRIG